MEEKIKRLASIIVKHSLKIKKEERVLITYQSTKCNDLVTAIIRELNLVNAITFVNLVDQEINIALKETTTSKRIEILKKYQQFEFDNFDSFIHIVYNSNDYETQNIPSHITTEIANETKDIKDKLVNDRKWILLNYPSMVDSFKSKKSSREFFKYAMDVMTVDYYQMSLDIKPLKQLMEKTKMVRITGPNTDISFSINGMPVIPCCGEGNLPDGEIFTAPIKNSVEGHITYNTVTFYEGEMYRNVCLKFKRGKVIEAICSEEDKIDKLMKVLSRDKGSKYVGEFAIGLNPMIKDAVGDILYDEKIIGSIHLTPGAAYKESYNGNDSTIHWDLVLIQRKEYGGGSLYFDDVLVRQDGLFVLPELVHLNYNMKK